MSTIEHRILVVDDEPPNVALLRAMLGDAGYRAVDATSDSSSALDLFDRFGPDLVLLDLHMPPPDGFELLSALRARTRDEYLPIVVLTADVTDQAKERAFAAGASDVLTKPFSYPDVLMRVGNLLDTRAAHLTLRRHADAVEAQLAEATRLDRERAGQEQAVHDRIDAVLAGSGLTISYQPVVTLDTDRVVGVEALARFAGPPDQGPDRWFAEAAAVGRGVELETEAIRLAVATIAPAIGTGPDDDGGLFVSLNASPATVGAGVLTQALGALPPSRVVLELTEHEHIGDYAQIHVALHELRRRGLRVAVDDTGAGYASLRHILELQPDLIKLDRDLITGIGHDPVRRALARAMLAFADELGATVVAEGIETTDELAALRRIGVRLGQGYLLGRPGPLTAGLTELTRRPAPPGDAGGAGRRATDPADHVATDPTAPPRIDPAAGVAVPAAEAPVDPIEALRQFVRLGEADRSRLARRVHDEPMQELHASRLQLELAARALAMGDEAGRAGALADIARSLQCLRAAAEQLGRIQTDVYPAALRYDGFMAALRDVVDGIGADLGWTIDGDTDPELPPEPAYEPVLVIRHLLAIAARARCPLVVRVARRPGGDASSVPGGPDGTGDRPGPRQVIVVTIAAGPDGAPRLPEGEELVFMAAVLDLVGGTIQLTAPATPDGAATATITLPVPGR